MGHLLIWQRARVVLSWARLIRAGGQEELASRGSRDVSLAARERRARSVATAERAADPCRGARLDPLRANVSMLDIES